MIEFNPNSLDHMSVLFFGGQIEDIEKVACGVYVSGQKKGEIKYKNESKILNIKGLGLDPLPAWKAKKEGFYSTKEEVLELIASKKETEAGKIAALMLKIRETEKLINTYYTSVEELIYDVDNMLHPSFTHCGTQTGRLTCSKPNIQNVPTNFACVKKHFVSRHNDGKIIVADYSQLEIRIQAQLCQDKAYIQDILNGIDFHIKRLALKERIPYENLFHDFENNDVSVINRRSVIKGFSFARAYGAGVNTIALQTGLSPEEIKQMIANEDLAYPQLKLFNDYNKDLVEKQGWYKDPWNRRYVFHKYPAKDWQKKQGIKESYSPTEIQNWKIQGFATGTVVNVMLGYFWRKKALLNREKYLLINTVHDSVMLDCKKEYVEVARKDLHLLEDVGKISKEVFNYRFNVPITIDIKEGTSWYDIC